MEGQETEGPLLPSAPDGLCGPASGGGLRESSSESVEASLATPGVSSLPGQSVVGGLASGLHWASVQWAVRPRVAWGPCNSQGWRW